MKKLLGITLSLVMLVALFSTLGFSPEAGATSEVNLIPGTVGTFETDTLPTEWDKRASSSTLEISTEQHHDGTRSMKHSGRTADTTAPRLYIHDYISAHGAGTYNVSMWVYIDGLTAATTAHMGLRCDAGAYSFLTTTARAELGFATVENKTWTQLSGQFIVTEADIALAGTQTDPAKAWGLCLTSGAGATTILYMDDVVLKDNKDDIPAATSGAASDKGYKYTVEGTNDIAPDGMVNLYMMNVVGHYDAVTDTATLYVMNTSDKTLTFQLCIGYAWGGSGKEITSAVGEKVKIDSGKAAKLTAENVSQYYKKTGSGTYDETQRLNGSSVVRLNVWGATAEDTFIMAGVSAIGTVKGNGASVDMGSNMTQVDVPATLAELISAKEDTADCGVVIYLIPFVVALAVLIGKRKLFVKL